MKRRGFIGAVVAGFLSGCLSQRSSPETPSSTDRNPAATTAHTETDHSVTDTPVGTSTHPEQCDSEYERTVAYTDYPTVTDQLDGLVLTPSQTSVEKGEEISFNLINESDDGKSTGNHSKYDIQRRTDDGWLSIFWKPTDELVIYESDGVLHPAGEGFTWEFTVTPDGLSHEIQHGEGHLRVCTPLQSGSYRFIFHGKVSYDENSPEAALGTRFSISND